MSRPGLCPGRSHRPDGQIARFVSRPVSQAMGRVMARFYVQAGLTVVTLWSQLAMLAGVYLNLN